MILTMVLLLLFNSDHNSTRMMVRRKGTQGSAGETMAEEGE